MIGTNTPAMQNEEELKKQRAGAMQPGSAPPPAAPAPAPADPFAGRTATGTAPIGPAPAPAPAPAGRPPTQAELDANPDYQKAVATANALKQNDPDAVFTAGNIPDTTTAGNKAKLDALSASIAARPNAQMTGAQLDATQSNEMRARQMGLADSLTASMNGTGPSAAQAQFQQNKDASMAQALALARSGKGDPAVAMKDALNQQANITQTAASQSAQLRAQEQQAATGQLAGVLDASRGQDLGAATTNANLAEQTGATNLEASVAQQKEKDARISDLMKTGMSLDEAQRQFALQQNQFNAGLLAQQSAARRGVAMQAAQNNTQIAGAGVSAAAALAGSLASAFA